MTAQRAVIGITGDIGAGKSTVAALLAEAGAAVIDADQVGHAVLERPEIREQLRRTFGEAICHVDGRIDRRALGAIVFADAAQRRRLEAIVHPVMRQVFEERIRQLGRDGVTLIVLDAAVLFEAGWDDLCSAIVFVSAPRPQREARLRASRGWSGAELKRRENAQLPPHAKRRRADVVIENDGPLAQCRRQLEPWRRRWTRPAIPPTAFAQD